VEVLEERSSVIRFLFLSRPRSSESVGGGDVVELVPSSKIFGFVSFLAVLSLGGFGGSGNRHILNGSSLWKRRARNKGLVILEGKQAVSYKKNNDKIKEGE
jgi:hypothetical protein